MKPTTDYGTTITSGTMKTGAATIELTPEMFTLLSDGMYQDKTLAPIRESICNARDAQEEERLSQGIDLDEMQPLEIHAPSRLEPYYHVRDFGGGLSETQVLGYFDEELGEYVPGLYLRYGKSTKRDSNLQIGGFGIGCKAPLAYSDSFIVESYQQGVVKTYTIYKEEGIPNVAKLSEKVTLDPDGLKVKIAVASADHSNFTDKIREFLKFFNYPVTITGQIIHFEPKYVLQTAQYNTVEVGYGDQGKIRASMGGVVYNVSDKYRQELDQVAKNTMLIMKFEIGDLSVAGSREALSEDTATLDALDVRVKEIRKDFFAVMKAKVEDPNQSIHEAIEVLRNFDLVRSDWRSSRWVATAAAKDFSINGEAVDDLLLRFSTIKVRTITRAGDATLSITAARDVPFILDVDRGSGYLKVAKRWADDSHGERILLSQTPDTMDLLKEYFGESNLKIEKVSDKYPVYFPKGIPTVGKVKVANSGLFNTNRVEVTEIDEGQKGYYIPFERFTCIMKGLPKGLGLDDFTKINRVIKAIIDAGKLDIDELFYSRKAGMRAVGKTNLKELEWDDVLKLAQKTYSKADYKEFLRSYTYRTGNPATALHKGLGPFWETVKDSYPQWANTSAANNTKGVSFLSNCGIVHLLEPTLEKDQQVITDTYTKESKQFADDYPILTSFGASWWKFEDDQVADIVAFCEWKREEKVLKNQKAA